jgi:hypothetical protein
MEVRTRLVKPGHHGVDYDTYMAPPLATMGFADAANTGIEVNPAGITAINPSRMDRSCESQVGLPLLTGAKAPLDIRPTNTDTTS